VQLHISVSDKHYRYLRRLAESEGLTFDSLLADIIEAEIAWRQTLASDPIRSLVGQLNDDFNIQDIDNVVYGLTS
jgi:hypothetical protein